MAPNARHAIAVLVASGVLSACGGTPAAKIAERTVSTPPKGAAAVETSAPTSRAPPVAIASGGSPATAVPVASTANPRAAGTEGTDAPSASLQGVAHDADIDPALLKDPFVLPGPITADTETDGLRRIYGAANVKEADVPGAEGETAHGVILFPDDPTRRAYIYFQDEKALTGLSMVSVLDPQSRWHSAQGIRMGTPLATLVTLNGGPFEFLGFDWDYSGQVTNWLGGRLDGPKNGPTLHVQLSHATLPKDISYDRLPIGDRSFRSDHPQLPRMKVVVASLSVNFPGKDDQ